MNRTRIRRFFAVLALASLPAAAVALPVPAASAPSDARDGFDDAPEALIGAAVVHDPKALVEAIKRARSLRDQIAILRDARSLLTGQWILMQEMTQIQSRLRRYRIDIPPWRHTEVRRDAHGKLAPWVSAVNTGRASEYFRSVLPLPAYGRLDRASRERAERLKTIHAWVRVADSAALHALRALADVRNRGPRTLEALDELQADSLRQGPTANHRLTAVLNRIDASGTAAARTAQAANQLLAARLEQDLAQAKMRRESLALALTADVAFREGADEAGRAGLVGSTRALRAFRLP